MKPTTSTAPGHLVIHNVPLNISDHSIGDELYIQGGQITSFRRLGTSQTLLLTCMVKVLAQFKKLCFVGKSGGLRTCGLSPASNSDRRPTQFLRHLQHLLGDKAASIDAAILRELFLQRLPASVRVGLVVAHRLPLVELAELADRIMEFSGPTIGATQQSPDLVSDIAELRREVQNLTTIVSELRRESRDHAQSSQQHSGRVVKVADASSQRHQAAIPAKKQASGDRAERKGVMVPSGQHLGPSRATGSRARQPVVSGERAHSTATPPRQGDGPSSRTTAGHCQQNHVITVQVTPAPLRTPTATDCGDLAALPRADPSGPNFRQKLSAPNLLDTSRLGGAAVTSRSSSASTADSAQRWRETRTLAWGSTGHGRWHGECGCYVEWRTRLTDRTADRTATLDDDVPMTRFELPLGLGAASGQRTSPRPR
ncbi:hypothetical protein HPB47_018499 [Ixodes persulcatus]|uniref:Uncharacterized protein n=1 Tax=Ixodes persulcatus TaxID=34615 RepID=A0AC60QMV9_IXOPE|nr:hypothetical protein HPB47_018499 [Ixodes persulcatus]